jgi:protein-S-isoprenylcysteine O-methyltransferase Ste14
MTQAVQQTAKRTWGRVARRIRVPLGFVFAAAYLYLARPTIGTLIAGGLLAASGVGIRAAASGQLRKNEELATTGPYSYTRNPLYLGSIFIGVGFAIASRDVWVWVLLAAMYVIIYVPVIREEETFLRSNFPDFGSYAARVPRLWPRWSGESLISHFSRDLYRKHREYNAVIGVLAMLLALLLKMALAHKNVSH